MRNTRLSKLVPHIAMASTLVMIFAGCQLSAPLKPSGTEDSISMGKSSKIGVPVGASSSAQAPTAKADAQVSGTVVDPSGKPVAGVEVNTYHGFKAVTDASGKFTIDVVGQDQLRLDFFNKDYEPRQYLTAVEAGMKGKLAVTLKPLDANLTPINALTGGRAVSADGNCTLDVPPGALKSDGTVRLTWLDPVPSKEFPESYGQLPGPLVSRTWSDGVKSDSMLMMPPTAFANVIITGEGLAPGAQATLRMKVNPKVLQMLNSIGIKDSPDEPAQALGPCYEYDRGAGLWVAPLAAKLEKDAQGNHWVNYTFRGKEAPKNYSLLQVMEDVLIGTNTIQVKTQKTVWQAGQTFDAGRTTGTNWYPTFYNTVAEAEAAGGDDWRSRRIEVTEDKIENIYGKKYSGTVTEQSSNPDLNGQGIADSTVSHNADYFGGTSKTTDAAGKYSIILSSAAPATSSVVNGSSWKGKRNAAEDREEAKSKKKNKKYRVAAMNSTGSGWNMVISTDGAVTINVLGGSVGYTADTSNLTSGTWTGAVNVVASRGSLVSLVAPAAPAYLSGATAMSGTVAANATFDFGTVKVVRDVTGKVVEHIGANPDNAQTPHNVDGAGLEGVDITGATDAVSGASSAKTVADGTFKLAILNNAATPTSLHADFLGMVSANSAAPFSYTLNTDSTYTITLGGGYKPLWAGTPLVVTYTVDGISYTKNLAAPADGKIPLTFCRDKTDNTLLFKIVSINGNKGGMMLASTGTMPTATLKPNGTASGTVNINFKDVVK